MKTRRRMGNRIPLSGPGETPALSLFGLIVLECFFVTQVALGFDFQGTQSAYTPPTDTGSRLSAEESRYDAQRVYNRNRRAQQTQVKEKQTQEEKAKQAQNTEEVEKAVGQDQQIKQAIGHQEVQEGNKLVERTTGLDSYSVDKDGGFWRSHLGLTAEGVNVLAGRDLYGNESRGHYYDFNYNSLFNVKGLTQDVKDAAGNLVQTVVSGIAYAVEYFRGVAPKGKNNEELARDLLTTGFFPTGNSTSRTQIREMKYENDKVVAQKATVTDLSGPNNPIFQDTSGMTYDDQDNLIASRTLTTDLATGVTTETQMQNRFSEHQLLSGVTKSQTKDFITNTFSEQTVTQNVSYEGGVVKSLDLQGEARTQAMDAQGNLKDDFVTVTQTSQATELFSKIPLPTKIVTQTHTIDTVNVQDVTSRQEQILGRDERGNLLTVSAAETSRVTNADFSVVQTTDSRLEFKVYADQSYLVGREDQTATHDGINETESVTTSRLKVELGLLHEVVGGEQFGQTETYNGDKSQVSSSEFRRIFDRASKVNGLGLVRQETKTRSENTIEETTTVENRVFSQAHDDFNRVLNAAEKFNSHTDVSNGGISDVTGEVTYAVAARNLQPYVVRSVTQATSYDPSRQLATDTTQVTEITSDEETGRALGGKNRTESVAVGTYPDGTRSDLNHIRTVSEETLQGLEKANGVALVARRTQTESLNVDHTLAQRTEQFTQQINGVGKVLGAKASSKTVTGIENSDYLHSTALTETDFLIIGNTATPHRNKSVEVAANALDGSYRVAAWQDETRYDPYGRILPINDEKSEQSGYQISYSYDRTIYPIPSKEKQVSPEVLFQQFFGKPFEVPNG